MRLAPLQRVPHFQGHRIVAFGVVKNDMPGGAFDHAFDFVRWQVQFDGHVGVFRLND